MAWVIAAGVIVLAIWAQIALTRQYVWWGLAVYGMALGLWLLAVRKDRSFLGKVRLPPALAEGAEPWYRRDWRLILVGVSLIATVVNVLYSRDDSFEIAGLVAWSVSVAAFVAAFWERRGSTSLASLGISRDGLRLSWFAVAFLVVLGLGAGFLLWRLCEIPSDMTWDHMHNLTDIRDVLERDLRPPFFYRNFGREPLQFYWTAALIRLTGLPIDFCTLKLSTAIASLLTIIGVYLMTREVYGRWVGLWAALFVGVASWPVILARLGVRCPLAPLACAWAFYFMLRGLRTGHRNDFLLLGLTLGAGLYGYTAFRAIPLAVVVCWSVVWLVARRGDLGRRLRWGNLALTVISALLVFAPLGVYMLLNPDSFWSRVSWYVTDHESAGRPVLVFLDNLKNLALMFHWRGDQAALNTLKYEPVLDPILGGLMIVGLVISLGRIASRRTRDALTLGLLMAGTIALLPSALSLPFPKENPSVMRTSAAIPVVFAIAALPVGIWTAGVARTWRRHGQRVGAWVCAIVLVVALVWVNGHRVFVRYAEEYRKIVASVSDVATAVRGFEATIGAIDDVYVIHWPWWVDARALAFELGVPGWHNRLDSADEAMAHVGLPTVRMYILHPSDTDNLLRLQEIFPGGLAHAHRSQWGQGFVFYIVPGDLQCEPPLPR